MKISTENSMEKKGITAALFNLLKLIVKKKSKNEKKVRLFPSLTPQKLSHQNDRSVAVICFSDL